MIALIAGFLIFEFVSLTAWIANPVFDRLRGFWREGICKNCGYDLTGNVSGICPECGTPVSEKSVTRRT